MPGRNGARVVLGPNYLAVMVRFPSGVYAPNEASTPMNEPCITNSACHFNQLVDASS